MATAQVEYVGFKSSDNTREYQFLVRRTDGPSEQFTFAIALEAFVAHRVRYQDGAEICFMKLNRALAEFAAAPDSGPLATHQNVTEQDLLDYKEAHTVKPKPRRTPPTPPPAAV